jgi:hypothetical protein
MLMQDIEGNAVNQEAQVDGAVHHVKEGATEKQAAVSRILHVHTAVGPLAAGSRAALDASC